MVHGLGGWRHQYRHRCRQDHRVRQERRRRRRGAACQRSRLHRHALHRPGRRSAPGSDGSREPPDAPRGQEGDHHQGTDRLMKRPVSRVLRVLLACSLAGAFPAVGAPGEKSAAAGADPVAKIESAGGAVRRIAKGSDALEVDFQFGGAAVTDDHLGVLPALGPVQVLRLKNTRITDAGLAHVGSLKGLKRLHLDGTAITDAGLKHLAGLKELESLNLFGTGITDAGVDALRALPKLRQVFIWQTDISPAAVARLRKDAPGLEVIPDPEAERERAESIGSVSKSALASAEAALAQAKKDVNELAPQAAQLKQSFEAAKALADKAKAKAADARKQADEDARRIEPAVKDAEAAARRAAAATGDAALAAQAQEKARLVAELRERAEKSRQAGDVAKAEDDQARKAFDEARSRSDKAGRAKRVLEQAEVAVASARERVDAATSDAVPLSRAAAEPRSVQKAISNQ
ncbi:MAG: hypothetical protein FJ382_15085 [Verrucomicrobia bacterium]|nr:hypothetical protein [Verrucomicrobiota bacterium]